MNKYLILKLFHFEKMEYSPNISKDASFSFTKKIKIKLEINIYFKISACLKINPILLFFKKEKEKEKEKEAAQRFGADVRLPAKRNVSVATKGACAEKQKKKKVARREEEEVRDQDCCISGGGCVQVPDPTIFFENEFGSWREGFFPGFAAIVQWHFVQTFQTEDVCAFEHGVGDLCYHVQASHQRQREQQQQHRAVIS